jgi:hypothetical protein
MATVDQIQRNLLFSIARLAAEFSMGRDTVAKRLAAANVPPAEQRAGHPVFRLRDAAPALLEVSRSGKDGEFDPRELPPKERKDWFNSEESRLSVEQKSGRLIPAAQVETEYAELVKSLAQFCDSLSGVLERKCDLTPEQAERVDAVVGEMRQALYDKIAGDLPAEQAAG